MINQDANQDSLTGLMENLRARIMKDIQKTLPCRVVSVSSDRRFVKVKLQIVMIDVNGNPISRQEEIEIQTYTSGAGGLFISFPVKVGDTGWIDASDRDISVFLQNLQESEPPTSRMHSFNDGRFIPDIMKDYTISSEDNDYLVIGKADGSIKISIGDEIRIVNGSAFVVVDGSSVKGVAPGGFDLNGCVIDSSGNVTTASGISLDDHVHTQGNDSAGNTEQDTGAPQ